MEPPSTEQHADILPLAFHILWRAAQAERRLDHAHAHRTQREDFAKSRTKSTDSTYENVMAQKLAENIMKDSNPGLETTGPRVPPTAQAGVVVLDCEDGEKLVKKVFQGARDASGLCRAEDLLVDWLNSELTSQHSRKVDVTVYLSDPPQGTTADGIRLWWRNLVEEGKRVTLTIKLAGLGVLSPWSGTEGGASHVVSEEERREEAEEITQGLQKLKENGAVVKPISPREWPTLLSLLTDRSALSSLESCYTAASQRLDDLLDSGSRT
ncbi:uncharacterized protein LOC101857268 [Aplysia californica]|uniref:Uncharacterized protein LOC101857268 n=1 Tax=Aplysia californica TaxID=6500 RepID=A0ABM1A5B1_APLCA|nr:uncharacterized protein LOC101857268 [Aplysia californica]